MEEADFRNEILEVLTLQTSAVRLGVLAVLMRSTGWLAEHRATECILKVTRQMVS